MASLHDCSVAAGESLFDALYAEHKPAVYGVALRLLGNREDAEEVTQETFLNAYRALADGTTPNNPRAWLLAIARNACRARWREKGYPVREVPLEDEHAVASAPSEAADPRDVRSALERLLPNHRRVLLLRELVGLSFGEIAARIGRSESAVHTLLFRARAAMRDELEASESPLSCGEAEALLAQRRAAMTQLERGLLRVHLRHCAVCAVEARRRRARVAALGLLAAPFRKLGTWLGLSSATGPAAKIGALVGAAALVGTATQIGPLAPGGPERDGTPATARATAVVVAVERESPAERRRAGQLPVVTAGPADRTDPGAVIGPDPKTVPAAGSSEADPQPTDVVGEVSRRGDRQDAGKGGSRRGEADAPSPEEALPLVEALSGVVASLPDVTVPDLPVPDLPLPEVTVPDLALPDVALPGGAESELPVVPAVDSTLDDLLGALPPLG